jgi:glucose/arabinose dehydrogenase
MAAVSAFSAGSELAVAQFAADSDILSGEEAFATDWSAAKPGQLWLITPRDLVAPFASESASNGPDVVPRPEGATPTVGPNYLINLFAEGLDGPRTIEVAPNGDVFVAESQAGTIRVFRPGPDGLPAESGEFATGLEGPYGLAFYPPGDNPQYLYVGEESRVVRFAYAAGDLAASGEPEVIVDGLPTGGHWTRDVAFSPDGTMMFIAVGSESNVAEDMQPLGEQELAAFEAERMVGAAWGGEDGRAAILTANPDGSELRYYASGIRNCSGLAIEPATGSPWCATNERDGLGDDLPTDYVTRVQSGGFYGWPWYYIGAREDPRHEGERPDLRQYVVTPDVLLQAHSAPLGLSFYEGEMFPELVGDVIVAMHGSWNRGKRTGYKVVRVRMTDGQPTGIYEDFITGFVLSADEVWGRPVGVAVAGDGSILISEDGSGTIWRVTAAPNRTIEEEAAAPEPPPAEQPPAQEPAPAPEQPAPAPEAPPAPPAP